MHNLNLPGRCNFDSGTHSVYHVSSLRYDDWPPVLLPLWEALLDTYQGSTSSWQSKISLSIGLFFSPFSSVCVSVYCLCHHAYIFISLLEAYGHIYMIMKKRQLNQLENSYIYLFPNIWYIFMNLSTCNYSLTNHANWSFPGAPKPMMSQKHRSVYSTIIAMDLKDQ